MSSVRVEYHQKNCETLERKPLDEARDKEAKGVQHVGAIWMLNLEISTPLGGCGGSPSKTVNEQMQEQAIFQSLATATQRQAS